VARKAAWCGNPNHGFLLLGRMLSCCNARRVLWESVMGRYANAPPFSTPSGVTGIGNHGMVIEAHENLNRI
jgi:hypothetical protein